ncbi:MAG: proline--tRNA ligase [Candidatus Aenigmatarchaeota archaeon]
MSEELGIKTKRSDDFSEWYLEVMDKCDIVDKRYPVKGFVVYKPWGMFVINQIFDALEEELQKTGHNPVSFPVLIPEGNLKKESEHVKSFEKEVFWITHAGENKLDERLLLRPTSETAFYPMYSLWIRSHTDLPLKLYQCAQIYRYETKMTKPLLRGREFFWIEAHTVQKTNEDAEKQVKEDMAITEKVLSEKLGLPFMLLQRPEWDKFPGAEKTYAYDTIMPDGKTLQVATTHNLGQKFSKPFHIKFANEKGDSEYAYQTCYGPGVSRIVGAVISVHGDDKGMILPPPVAPTQVIVIPIPIKGKEELVEKEAKNILKEIEKLGLRARIDSRGYRPGFKFHEWEMKGVPIRIEIGPKDIEKKQFIAVRRDTGEKIILKDAKKVGEMLDVIYKNLKETARKNFESRIRNAKSFQEISKNIENGGLVGINFCSMEKDGEKCAEKIEKELHAEIRGAKLVKEKPTGNCVICGKPAKHVVYVAKAY